MDVIKGSKNDESQTYCKNSLTFTAFSRSARPSLLCARYLFYPALLSSSSPPPPPAQPPPPSSLDVQVPPIVFTAWIFGGATLKSNKGYKKAAAPGWGVSPQKPEGLWGCGLRQMDFSRSPSSCVLSAVFCWDVFVSGPEEACRCSQPLCRQQGLQMWVRHGSASSPTDHSKRILLSAGDPASLCRGRTQHQSFQR